MFLTDQLAAYGKALLTHFGHWVEKVSEKSGRILRRWMSRTPATCLYPDRRILISLTTSGR